MPAFSETSNVRAEPAVSAGSSAPNSRLTSRQVEAMSVEELESLLASDAHRLQTLTRDYGPLDPLEATPGLIWRCKRSCSASLVYDVPSDEQLHSSKGEALKNGVAANFVSCRDCGKLGTPSLREWRAVVDWNFLRAREGHGSLERFPFFELDGLSTEEKEAKLLSIQTDLFIRRALERKRKGQGQEVGRRYLAKLDAYYGWVSVAAVLLRQMKDQKPAR